MALINGYAACGQFEKAKQVLHILYRFLHVLSQLQSIFFPTWEPKTTIRSLHPLPVYILTYEYLTVDA